MRVFLSWSGKVSHEVAITLRDWLPLVIQSVDTYVSSEDIDKGTRWSMDIAQELETCSYGVICVTKQNLAAPWVNFEAGALSKFVSESFVSPFLFDIKKSDVTGPLVQFQATSYEKEDVKKLIKGINKACGEQQLTESRLDSVFEAMWPLLNKNLDAIMEKSKEELEATTETLPEIKENTSDRVLEEILELARSQQKILKTPKELFPQDYFKDQLSNLFNEVSTMLRTSKEAEQIKAITQKLYESLKELEITYERFPSEKIFAMNPDLQDCESVTEILEVIRNNQNNIVRKVNLITDELHYITNKMTGSIEFRLAESTDRWTIPDGWATSDRWNAIDRGRVRKDTHTKSGVRRVQRINPIEISQPIKE